MAKLELMCDDILDFSLSSKKYSTDSMNIFNINFRYSNMKYKFIDNKTQTLQAFIKWLELTLDLENNKNLGVFKDESNNFIAYINDYDMIVFEFVILKIDNKIISTYSFEDIDEKDLKKFIEELKNEHNNKFKKEKYISKKYTIMEGE